MKKKLSSIALFFLITIMVIGVLPVCAEEKTVAQDFNSDTNQTISLSSFTFEVPSTWSESDDRSDTLLFFYPTDGMLQVQITEMNAAITDEANQEAFISTLKDHDSISEWSELDRRVVNIPCGMSALYFTSTCTISNTPLKMYVVCISYDNDTQLIAFCYYDYDVSEYDRADDFWSIIYSISYSESKRPVGETEAQSVSDTASSGSDLFDDVFDYLGDKIDSITYNDCISYLDSAGCTYDATAPENGYAGQIITSEDEDGFKVYAFFSENNSGLETLNLLSYSNGDYEVSVSDNYHTSGTIYNIHQKNGAVQDTEVNSLTSLETFIHTDLPEIMNGNYSDEYLKSSVLAGTTYKLKYGTLVSSSESKSDVGTSLIIEAKITSSYSNEATINQNYMNVCDLIQNQGCSKYDEIQYWAVADMSSGNESKVVSFTVNKNLIQKIAANQVVDITLGNYVDDLYIHNSLLH